MNDLCMSCGGDRHEVALELCGNPASHEARSRPDPTAPTPVSGRVVMIDPLRGQGGDRPMPRLRTGRRNRHNLYLQAGDRPSDHDECLGFLISPIVSVLIVDLINSLEGAPERVRNAWVGD